MQRCTPASQTSTTVLHDSGYTNNSIKDVSKLTDNWIHVDPSFRGFAIYAHFSGQYFLRTFSSPMTSYKQYDVYLVARELAKQAADWVEHYNKPYNIMIEGIPPSGQTSLQLMQLFTLFMEYCLNKREVVIVSPGWIGKAVDKFLREHNFPQYSRTAARCFVAKGYISKLQSKGIVISGEEQLSGGRRDDAATAVCLCHLLKQYHPEKFKVS